MKFSTPLASSSLKPDVDASCYESFDETVMISLHKRYVIMLKNNSQIIYYAPEARSLNGKWRYEV